MPASEALVETAGIPQSAPFPFLPSVSFQIRTKNHRPRRFPPPSAFPVHQTHRKVWDDVWESICGLTKRFSVSQEGICVPVVKRTGFGRVCYGVEVKVRQRSRKRGQSVSEQKGAYMGKRILSKRVIQRRKVRRWFGEWTEMGWIDYGIDGMGRGKCYRGTVRKNPAFQL